MIIKWTITYVKGNIGKYFIQLEKSQQHGSFEKQYAKNKGEHTGQNVTKGKHPLDKKWCMVPFVFCTSCGRTPPSSLLQLSFYSMYKGSPSFVQISKSAYIRETGDTIRATSDCCSPSVLL